MASKSNVVLSDLKPGDLVSINDILVMVSKKERLTPGLDYFEYLVLADKQIMKRVYTVSDTVFTGHDEIRLICPI